MKRNRKKWGPRVILLKLLTYLVIIYGGLTLVVALFQAKLIFQASRELYRDPSEYGWEFETVWLEVGEERTHGWYVPIEGARGVALFSHGNAGNIAGRLESIGLLHELGLSVFAYDYGGYGKSTGKPSEARCYADIRAAYRYLTETRGVAPEEIVLFGRSLGGAVTIDLATEMPAAAVVAESCFVSMYGMARSAYPYLFVGPFLRHHFNSIEKVGEVEAPLLLIHSPEDDIVPFTHGQQLFERATAPKTFLEISGNHNEGFIESFTVYKQGWEDFLAPLLPRPESGQG